MQYTLISSFRRSVMRQDRNSIMRWPSRDGRTPFALVLFPPPPSLLSMSTPACSNAEYTITHAPVDNTLGAWLLGAFFALILSGFLFLQAYLYFRLYPDDRRLLRIWVLIMLVFETFTTVMVMHTTYYYAITKYWDAGAFDILPPVWSVSLLPGVGSITGLVSQVFFARRVWILSSKLRPVVAIAMVLILGYCGCFVAMSVKLSVLQPSTRQATLSALTLTDRFQAPSVSSLYGSAWIISVASAVQMVADMMITSTLIYLLRRHRTGFRRTNSILDTLIAYVLSTGLITCFFHIINVICSAAWSKTFIWATTSCILLKLYANTFLVALNIRKSLGTLGDTEENTSRYPQFQRPDRREHSRAMSPPASPIELNIRHIDTSSRDGDEEHWSSKLPEHVLPGDAI
ncbi:hypothetical protein BD311DRAFT_795578 [Dichomitus squalens]|uniref:DUF6534 domain-containing protein n=1 Tax=Dichomitus squalens TaxID=114155 RepID=A0A4Q9MTN1_9APHY|nr:hypothetical protein BD311DRAFT_795578 [Dichomitus squalens]